jgi:sugar phosphate isomerase/epimerase
MRLGGPVFEAWDGDPERWALAVRNEDYRAAFSPVTDPDDTEGIGRFAAAAEAHDIVIAEVGAWSNPISSDEEESRKAMELCKKRLAVAEEIGARCCVNIAGSRGRKWDGPHRNNLSDETFEMIVETTRQIIDAVRPKRTFYTLETMPWVFPDSVDSYLRLLEAMDRSAFAVHLDPVNIINSPAAYYNNGAVIRACFEKLGPHIRSCHAKDIRLQDRLTVHLDEVLPGTGDLDYQTYLEELDKLPPDTPLMLEHLKDGEAYLEAREYITAEAMALGVST